MDFLKSIKLLTLLASMIWKVGGAVDLKRWVNNGIEIVQRKIRDTETETDDVLLLPGIDLVRDQFGLPDIPDDQALDWSINLDF